MTRIRKILSVVRLGLSLVRTAAPRLLAFTIVLQVVAGLATIAVVVLGGRLAERMVRIPDVGTSGMGPILGAFLVLSFVGLTAALVKAEYQNLLGEHTERHATDTVLDAVVRADLIDYESPAFHDLLIRALESASSRPTQLASALLGLVSSGVTVVGLGIALLTLSPILLAVVLGGTIPLWWTARAATKRSYAFHVAQSERDRRSGYFLSALASRGNAAEIRVFGIGTELRRRIRALHGARIADLAVLARSRALLATIGAAISVAIGGVVVLVLADLFDSGDVAVDQAAVAVAAVLVLSQRLQTLNSSAASVLECALFLEDVERFNLARMPAANDGAAPPIDSIALDNVSFTYPASEHPALSDVSITLRSAELVAFVGENGSGKTTLVRIMSLLYPPTDGSVLINGQPHDHRNSAGARRRIAVVHQDFLELLVTAADNIALGDVTAVDALDRIAEAARFGGIHDVIARMPQGFDTMLGTEFSGGLELSGGQWQRLSIARAWFRDADVIILDEPTSALDPRAEIDLIDKIRALAADKLVVLITHRFGTVAKADRIVVMHEGHMVEHGSHTELMSLDGVYASLYTIQADGFR